MKSLTLLPLWYACTNKHSLFTHTVNKPFTWAWHSHAHCPLYKDDLTIWGDPWSLVLNVIPWPRWTLWCNFIYYSCVITSGDSAYQRIIENSIACGDWIRSHPNISHMRNPTSFFPLPRQKTSIDEKKALIFTESRKKYEKLGKKSYVLKTSEM